MVVKLRAITIAFVISIVERDGVLYNPALEDCKTVLYLDPGTGNQEAPGV